MISPSDSSKFPEVSPRRGGGDLFDDVDGLDDAVVGGEIVLGLDFDL